MNKKFLRMATSVILIGGLAGGLMTVTSCSKKDDKKEAEQKKGPGRAAQSVNIAQVSDVDFSPEVVIAGQVSAQNEARIFPTSSGARVIQLLADVGQYVNAGQALARLDSRQINADNELLAAQVRRAKTTLAEAEVSLASSKETMNRTLHGPKETNLSFEQAQIAYNEAKSQYDRALATKTVGALSAEEVERRRTTLQQAEARLNSQRGDVAAILEGRRQAVSQAEARVVAAKSDLNVAIAQQKQSDSRQNGGIIASPVSGLVTARNVAVGDIAGAAGTPMFTIVANGVLEVWAEVSESEIGQLSIGMPAQFTAPDGSAVIGNLRQLPAAIDAQKRTGIAKFILQTTPSVRAGMFLSGKAQPQSKMVMVIPSSALLYDASGTSVYVMRPDNSVTKQKVTLGSRQGNLVEVTTGLAKGAWVVTSGASFLAENEKINPTQTTLDGKVIGGAQPQQKQPANNEKAPK